MIRVGLGNIVIGTVNVLLGAGLLWEHGLPVGAAMMALGIWFLWNSVVDDDDLIGV